MEREAQIHAALAAALSPTHIELVNESHMHHRPGSDSHFNVIIVSAAFEGKRTVARQRMVHRSLTDIWEDGMHAFSMKTLTPAEYARDGAMIESVACSGS